MHGLTTIEKLNRENAEAYERMKAAGYDLPKIERAPGAPVEVHKYTPLPEPKKA